MSFWDIVWFIFITWAFVAYLMVMFSIIGDIFRDRELSGVVKALWCFALVFFPFITALIYLCVRGRSMAERSARGAARAQQRQDAYIREVAGQTTPADQIAQAKSLLDAGAISQPEYDALKAKALGLSPDAPAVPRARGAGDGPPRADRQDADQQVEAKS